MILIIIINIDGIESPDLCNFYLIIISIIPDKSSVHPRMNYVKAQTAFPI